MDPAWGHDPLGNAALAHLPPPGGAAPQRLQVCIGGHALAGELTLVPQARGVVVLASVGDGGDGPSSPLCPGNRLLADILQGYRLDTLQLDLLTAHESDLRECAMDVDLLGQRLTEALVWLRTDPSTSGRCVGVVGADSSAAAALQATAQRPGWVGAVVSRGGRPDLAGPWLARVHAPTLLIVGGADAEVLRLNRDAARGLRCDWRLEVVPGATHRFEEAGATETVAHLAGTWFANRLRRPAH